MTTISGSGEFIEIGNLEVNDQPGIRIRRSEGDLVIYGLTREEAKSMADHFLNEVTVAIEVKSPSVTA
ncbi:hypothetical protein QYH69_32350 [Paraburkholderia sp. SARCC-3016]|uniref:hypothetical protein n=1 Tax=Paraburkholderia sp. SARCC-3016 TaxID=3058611 RepID=UPI0028073051|nr:hypothetical protein [Paraburkholderia sp. SARCC-3016]MDQ7981916.1 hypothetical protein [Paraburkholderia sp. SARCC-3016]